MRVLVTRRENLIGSRIVFHSTMASANTKFGTHPLRVQDEAGLSLIFRGKITALSAKLSANKEVSNIVDDWVVNRV